MSIFYLLFSMIPPYKDIDIICVLCLWAAVARSTTASVAKKEESTAKDDAAIWEWGGIKKFAHRYRFRKLPEGFG